MFSMKPPLLLGTGDCGLASLLAGLYWGRCEGGVEEVPGGGPWTSVSGLKYCGLWSTSLNIYSAATSVACHNP